MRIAAGHSDARMPEEFLNRPQRHVAFAELCRERVSQDVPRDALDAGPITERVEVPRGTLRSRQCVVEERKDIRMVVSEGLYFLEKLCAQRNSSAPSVLRWTWRSSPGGEADTDIWLRIVEVNVVPAKRRGFAEAAAGLEQEQDEGSPIPRICRTDEAMRFLGR